MLFVAVPVIVALCASIAFYGLYVKRKSAGTGIVKESFQKGLIYTNLNRHTEAVAEFRKELEKNPDNINAHYQLGISLSKLKEFDKAATEFNAVLKNQTKLL